MKNVLNNQDLNDLSHGEFKDTKELPMAEISNCMDTLAKLQRQCGQTDMNSLMSLYHDGLTGQILGFDQVNTSKHGLDCKTNGQSYLEVKSISWNNQRLGRMFASFPGATRKKAAIMQDDNVWLAVGVWFALNDLGFIVFGQNAEIGRRIDKKAKKCKPGITAAVQIPLSSLITKYNFQIISVSKTEEEIRKLLSEYNPQYDDTQIKIISINDFSLENKSGGDFCEVACA